MVQLRELLDRGGLVDHRGTAGRGVERPRLTQVPGRVELLRAHLLLVLDLPEVVGHAVVGEPLWGLVDDQELHRSPRG